MSKRDDLDELARSCFGKTFSELSADNKIDILDLYNEREE